MGLAVGVAVGVVVGRGVAVGVFVGTGVGVGVAVGAVVGVVVGCRVSVGTFVGVVSVTGPAYSEFRFGQLAKASRSITVSSSQTMSDVSAVQPSKACAFTRFMSCGRLWLVLLKAHQPVYR